MAKRAVSGLRPVAFGATDRRQIVIPLSALYFDDDGIIHASDSYSREPSLQQWLEYLVKQRQLVPAAAPAPLPVKALGVTAVNPGSTGNNVVIKTEAAGEGAVHVTVTITDVYEKLTLVALEDVLGSEQRIGSRPGLLYVHSVSDLDPAAGDGFSTDEPIWWVPSEESDLESPVPDSPSFELAPRRKNIELGLVTVCVDEVQPSDNGDPTTFTLTVKWERVVNDVTLDTLSDFAQAVGFAIEVKEPEDGFKLPRPGSVSLRGGSDPTLAQATLLATE